jgi:uncharacterized protein (UPF0248 family)
MSNDSVKNFRDNVFEDLQRVGKIMFLLLTGKSIPDKICLSQQKKN